MHLKPVPEWAVRWSWPTACTLAGSPKQEPDNIVRMTRRYPQRSRSKTTLPGKRMKSSGPLHLQPGRLGTGPAKLRKVWKRSATTRRTLHQQAQGKMEASASGVSHNDSHDCKNGKIYARVPALSQLSLAPRKTNEGEKKKARQEEKKKN